MTEIVKTKVRPIIETIDVEEIDRVGVIVIERGARKSPDEEYAQHETKIAFKGINHGDCIVYVQITNLTPEMVLFKMKASHAKAFTIHPASVGLVHPKNTDKNAATLVLTLHADRIKPTAYEKLTFLLQTCNVPFHCRDVNPHALWNNKHDIDRYDLNGTMIVATVEKTKNPLKLDKGDTVHILLEEGAKNRKKSKSKSKTKVRISFWKKYSVYIWIAVIVAIVLLVLLELEEEEVKDSYRDQKRVEIIVPGYGKIER